MTNATGSSETPNRQPVSYEIPLSPRKWATETRQVVMGVDPGFAEMGVVLVERESPSSPMRALWVETIRTAKAAKKVRADLRVTNDDQRRYRELIQGLRRVHAQFQPYAVGVEAYTLNPYQQGGVGLNAGAKTMAVYGGVLAWGVTLELYVAAYLPSDLKRRFCGKQGASKTEVRNAVYQQVVGLQDLIEARPKAEHEHLGDAAGHAVLVLEEIDQMRKMLGLG